MHRHAKGSFGAPVPRRKTDLATQQLACRIRYEQRATVGNGQGTSDDRTWVLPAPKCRLPQPNCRRPGHRHLPVPGPLASDEPLAGRCTLAKGRLESG